MQQILIGRETEKQVLLDALSSPKPELVALGKMEKIISQNTISF